MKQRSYILVGLPSSLWKSLETLQQKPAESHSFAPRTRGISAQGHRKTKQVVRPWLQVVSSMILSVCPVSCRRVRPAPWTLLLRAAVRIWRLIGMYGDRKSQPVYCRVCGNNLTAAEQETTLQQEAGALPSLQINKLMIMDLHLESFYVIIYHEDGEGLNVMSF